MRQRNRRGCIARRWSGGYFYLYLAEKGYDLAHYWQCVRCLKEAACANPVLLLKTGIYRTFIKTVSNIIKGSTGIHLAEPARTSPGKMRKGIDLHSKKKESVGSF
jgi:hypothetical protein